MTCPTGSANPATARNPSAIAATRRVSSCSRSIIATDSPRTRPASRSSAFAARIFSACASIAAAAPARAASFCADVAEASVWAALRALAPISWISPLISVASSKTGPSLHPLAAGRHSHPPASALRPGRPPRDCLTRPSPGMPQHDVCMIGPQITMSSRCIRTERPLYPRTASISAERRPRINRASSAV